jgi:hypothetical protein
MLWCDLCSDFHPRTSFEKKVRDAPDDGRECKYRRKACKWPPPCTNRMGNINILTLYVDG